MVESHKDRSCDSIGIFVFLFLKKTFFKFEDGASIFVCPSQIDHTRFSMWWGKKEDDNDDSGKGKRCKTSDDNDNSSGKGKGGKKVDDNDNSGEGKGGKKGDDDDDSAKRNWGKKVGTCTLVLKLT